MRYQYYLQEPYFTVENIDIVDVTRPKDYTFSFRTGRKKHGFIYVIKGKIRYRFRLGSKKEIYLNEGELIFIPSDGVYTARYLEEETQLKIVQFDLATGELPEYMSGPIKIEFPGVKKIIEAFFVPVENYLTNSSFYYISCLYNLLWHISERYLKVPTKVKKLQPALIEMNEQFKKNEKISHYADLCGMSEVNFRRIFKNYTGMSPIEYRNDIRLINARALLRSGEYNVSEVAENCGFTNLAFFIRLYKKKYGYTPKNE